MAVTSLSLRLDELAPFLKNEAASAIDRMNWPRTFKAIALMLEGATKDNFQREQAPDGTPWAPLKKPRPRSAGMGKADASKGERDRILADTGVLKASVTGRSSEHTISDVLGSKFEWGTNVEYGRYHQEGTKNQDGTKRMQARPFIGFNDQLEDEISSLLADELSKVMFT